MIFKSAFIYENRLYALCLHDGKPTLQYLQFDAVQDVMQIIHRKLDVRLTIDVANINNYAFDAVGCKMLLVEAQDELVKGYLDYFTDEATGLDCIYLKNDYLIIHMQQHASTSVQHEQTGTMKVECPFDELPDKIERLGETLNKLQDDIGVLAVDVKQTEAEMADVIEDQQNESLQDKYINELVNDMPFEMQSEYEQFKAALPDTDGTVKSLSELMQLSEEDKALFEKILK